MKAISCELDLHLFNPPIQGQMTTTIDTTTTTIADFNTWCDFITDGLDQTPDNGDSKQALNDDKE